MWLPERTPVVFSSEELRSRINQNGLAPSLDLCPLLPAFASALQLSQLAPVFPQQLPGFAIVLAQSHDILYKTSPYIGGIPYESAAFRRRFRPTGPRETLWELAGLATLGTHGGYNDSPE